MEPDKLTKLMEDLTKANQSLTETITARFTPADPAARKAETDALVATVLAKMSEAGFRKADPVRKMVWGTPSTKADEGTEVMPFNAFLKAVHLKDGKLLEAMAKTSPNGASETVADGGYSVPVEYANEIINLERTSGIARGLCRIFPMGSLTRKVPKQLASPSVYWVAEGAEPSALSKGTLDQITQTAKKMAAICPFTDELLEDNNVSYDQFIAQAVALAMSREEDKLVFVGDVSGLTDPFNGVYFGTGVGSVSLEGAALAYPDLVNLLMKPKAPYRQRGKFVLSGTALTQVMKLIDDNKRPIWTMPDAGNPGRILGKEYAETDQIPDTLGTTRTNGTNTAILFGAWDGVWISPRGGYTVKASDSASDSSGHNAFTQGEVWFKFQRRESIDVANGEALAKMAVPTT
jgi:HK97 family phage major capsid protein